MKKTVKAWAVVNAFTNIIFQDINGLNCLAIFPSEKETKKWIRNQQDVPSYEIKKVTITIEE